jgi:RNA polymerase sigma-70 factor (ECF subfamily)
VWLVTVAARTALKQRRGRAAQPHDSISGLAQIAVEAEPELALAKARYAPELDKALRTALDTLDPRQRVLLRLHYAEGWSIDRLGALYQVGRSTSARWIIAAREALHEATKTAMQRRLQLTTSEFESLVGLVQSQLEVSLIRLLEESDSAINR